LEFYSKAFQVLDNESCTACSSDAQFWVGVFG
jgi:hypothetical protein